MERRTLPLLAVFALLLGLIPGRALAEPPTGSADELLVKFRANVSKSAAEETVGASGAEAVDEIARVRVHRIRAANGQGAKVIERLRRRADVEFVEQDAAHAPADVPNDPEYANQWHLPKIGAPAAWTTTHGSNGIVIAILDSGVDGAHPDLASKMVPGWNTYQNNADTADVYGHGTKVAGAAAAATNNALGVAGVAWDSSIMPIRVTDTAGYGYTSAMASGITWAVDRGASVINLSFETMASSATVRSAAQYAMSRGALVVVAAGNCGCDDPTAENPYVLSVGATDSIDGLAGFSARGAFVDVVAPGVMIKTTVRGGGMANVAGTSFASPVVAGVAALLMSVNPSASPDEIASWLEGTALDLGAVGHDSSFGAGRVRVDLAVAAAAESEPPPVDGTAPSAAITSPQTGATVAGTVNVTATAFDDRAVAKVELWVDGQLRSTDTSSPYSFAWNTTTLADGGHTLVAIAQDATGNRGSSASVPVSVANQVDVAAPAAFMDSPTAGASLSRNATIKARATDDLDVARLEVLMDGQLIASTSCMGTSCTLSTKWNLKSVAKGGHSMTAKAIDRSGKSTTSAPITITVR